MLAVLGLVDRLLQHRALRARQAHHVHQRACASSLDYTMAHMGSHGWGVGCVPVIKESRKMAPKTVGMKMTRPKVPGRYKKDGFGATELHGGYLEESCHHNRLLLC